MPNLNPLHEYVGLITNVIPALSYPVDSDTTTAGTDFNTVSVAGHTGLLCILEVGGIDSDDSFNVNLLYASSGSASDLAEWSAATDAVFSTLDTDFATPEILHLDLLANGVSGGIVGAEITNAVASDSEEAVISLIIIPYGGDMVKPISQTNTVISV